MDEHGQDGASGAEPVVDPVADPVAAPVAREPETSAAVGRCAGTVGGKSCVHEVSHVGACEPADATPD